jgi:hypothetical protein
MTKVLSVNDGAKVWEIKKVAEICHFTSTQKGKVIIIASPVRAYLDKKCNTRSRGRLSIG